MNWCFLFPIWHVYDACLCCRYCCCKLQPAAVYFYLFSWQLALNCFFLLSIRNSTLCSCNICTVSFFKRKLPCNHHVILFIILFMQLAGNICMWIELGLPMVVPVYVTVICCSWSWLLLCFYFWFQMFHHIRLFLLVLLSFYQCHFKRVTVDMFHAQDTYLLSRFLWKIWWKICLMWINDE